MCIAYIRSRQVLSGAYEPPSLFVKSYDHALVQSYDYLTFLYGQKLLQHCFT